MSAPPAAILVANAVDDAQARIAGADTAAELLAAVTELLDLEPQLLELRLLAARELRRDGLKLEHIAGLAGVTRSRISQLLGPTDEVTARHIHRHQKGPNP